MLGIVAPEISSAAWVILLSVVAASPILSAFGREIIVNRLRIKLSKYNRLKKSAPTAYFLAIVFLGLMAFNADRIEWESAADVNSALKTNLSQIQTALNQIPAQASWPAFITEALVHRIRGRYHELDINYFVYNYGPQATVSHYDGVTLDFTPEHTSAANQHVVISKLRNHLRNMIRAQQNRASNMAPKEYQYFTGVQPSMLLSKDAFKRLLEQKATLYFLAVLVVNNSFGTRNIPACGIIQGNLKVINKCYQEDDVF